MVLIEHGDMEDKAKPFDSFNEFLIESIAELA